MAEIENPSPWENLLIVMIFLAKALHSIVTAGTR
jgi:hypothetical protein